MKPNATLLLDLEMLVSLAGRERTEAEYAELLRQAGFRHSRTVGTVGPASVIEAPAVEPTRNTQKRRGSR